MATHDADDRFSAIGMDRQQVVLLSQIEKSIMSMYHIDELFQWFSQVLVQYFNIRLLLFWTNRVGPTGQLIVQLRTIARQDPSLPEQIVVNEQLQSVAQRLMNERASYEPQPLETLFSYYQTVLLKRYGIQYWGGCFTSRNALLPPRLDAFTRREAPAYLAMMTLLFFRHAPQAGMIAAMNGLLERTMDLALARGLLLSPADPHRPPASFSLDVQVNPQLTPFPSTPVTPMPPLPVTPVTPNAVFPSITSQPPVFAQPVVPPVQETAPVFAQLIPSRKQDANMLLATNPFARSSVISDKKARRLHTAIDGQATIAQLSTLTGMNMQEISRALRLLWEQDRIEVHEASGKLVNLAFFLKDQ